MSLSFARRYDWLLASSMSETQLPKNKVSLKTITSNDLERESATPSLHEAAVRAATQILETQVGWISVVDSDVPRIAAAVGDLSESLRSYAVALHARLLAIGEPVFVGDKDYDARFHDEDMRIGDVPIRFFAGIPMSVSEQKYSAVLCVVDTQPRVPSRAQMETFVGLSNLIRSSLATNNMVKELASMRAFSNSMLETVADAVITTDRLARVKYMNRAAETFTGWTRDQAIGKPLRLVFRLLMSLQDTHPLDPVEQALRKNEMRGLGFAGVLIDRKGKESPVEYFASPVNDQNNERIGAVLAFRELSQSRGVAARMAYLAQHDQLTDLPNRVLMRDRVSQAIAAARRHGRKLALLFVDLDRFKSVNDSFGHDVGDRLLREVAERLQRGIRASDTLSRQGGDEFLVLLTDIESAADVGRIAAKLLASGAEPFMFDGHELRVSLSIGISLYPSDGEDFDSLMRNADAAMYHAKTTGRNAFEFYISDMNARAQQRTQLETGLPRALERGELILHYQPKVDAVSHRIIGVEALIRWQHPERGMIPPSEFIPLAEENGLIVPIGAWVLREACRQHRLWQAQGREPVPIAVNISAVQLRHRSFAKEISTALSASGMDPNFLMLELTESSLMDHGGSTRSLLDALNQAGVRFSIDDFGLGYSSLSYLRRFPISSLKIDQSFVRDLATDPDDAAITGAIISMAKSLKLRVVAEGVETEAQMKFLSERGCDAIQGFYFYKPMPSEAVARLLQ